ncbi:unnamed protein product [Kuraishia capsulata CBS 1993]|uniref:PAN2-PAN3 deadenylation complex catalytic subunit PAN2 n=1 Tax=Kuraishia capsulata CBS 1993 TaxID=1382522 RepID=W6MFN7_9ASCO|nr:uncharacterized protein KUCA_T00000393001 [Kuraishia capsulata CBS 1993]CDK24431.1 unnamed protein product [Kuraishia capsulata CBS 1993]
MDGWHEVTRFFGVNSPINMPNVTPPAATQILFDDSEELIWISNSTGHISSFSDLGIAPYTKFRAHETAVIQMLNHQKGILSLSNDSLSLTSRTGVPIYRMPLSGLSCMAYTSNTQNELLVGGSKGELIKVDTNKGIVTNTIPYEHSAILMAYGAKQIVIGKIDGSIDVFDLRQSTVIKTFAAHSGLLSTIHCKDNILLSCGFTKRQDKFLADPLVNVYDIRSLRPLAPIPFPPGAFQVRLHPTLPSAAIIASQTGQIHVVDIYNSANVQLYHAQMAAFGSSLEVAPSGNAFALMDGFQEIIVWGRGEDPPKTVLFANPLVYPSMEHDTQPTAISIDKDDDPLNGVKLPYYSDTLLSAWPIHAKFTLGAMPEKIDPEILHSSKRVQQFLVAPYDHDKFGKRNVSTKFQAIKKLTKNGVKVPKFISERATLETENSKSETLKNQTSMFEYTSRTNNVPNCFSKVEILYSKFGVDDFDFDFYNVTKYAGLETNVSNSYCNPLLQVYRFDPLLFNFAVSSLSQEALESDLLLSELGYLFDMLVKANGKHCCAANFQRLMCLLPEVKKLGLLDDDGRIKDSYGQRRLIQAFNKYLLIRLSTDEKTQRNLQVSSNLDSIMGIYVETIVSSVFCNARERTMDVMHSFDIASLSTNATNHKTIGNSVLTCMETCMNRHVQQQIACSVCGRQHLVEVVTSVAKLPPLLSLNLNLNDEELNELRDTKGWLPSEFYFAKNQGRGFFSPTNDNNIPADHFELVAYVAQITSKEGLNHLVSLIRIDDAPTEMKWHLFNDFLVMPLPESEVMNFSSWWKRPIIAVYRNTAISVPFAFDIFKRNLNDSILYRDHFAEGTRKSRTIEYELLTKEEAPTPGTLVAIDAEFVQLAPAQYEFKSDGKSSLVCPRKLSLARVSVIRGEDGPKYGVPFIDDYISTTVAIDDYLTSYSGIEPGDLDSAVSTKSLVDLRTAYRKLWLLLNMGCVFVGHGLKSDFRTINIQVPQEQVRDTINMFYLKKEKRVLSLKFLVYILLNERVQTGNHDSIEDARSALLLYRKYLDLEARGELQIALNKIYSEGQYTRFKVPEQ